MTAQIRLLSTDFDGTLIGHPSDGRCVPELGETLRQFKERGGLWAVNTGRSLDHAVEGIALFRAPVEPDFLLTNERELFRPDGCGGWAAVDPWNHLCGERHRALFQDATGILNRILEAVDGSPDVTIIREGGHPAGLLTSDEAVMESVAGRMDVVREQFPEFNYQRNTIYLRFCHSAYHKGAALAELCRILEISSAEVFACGDQYNDLPMLDRRYAGEVACPANAIPEVKQRVREHGGWVAGETFGLGIAEAMRQRVLVT